MFIGVTALVLYIIAWMLLFLSFNKRQWLPAFYTVLTAALGNHLYFLYQVIDTSTGQNLHIFNVLSFITALWVAIVGIANFTTRLNSLFVLVLPLAGLSLLPIVLGAAPMSGKSLGGEPMALGHILLALAAYALLGVAFLQAIALSLQRHYLSRSPAHDALPQLPPLEAMQTLMFRVLLAAFIMLTIGLAIGLGLGIGAQGISATLLSFKNAASIMVWLLCAILLFLYHHVGLQVRYAIIGIGLAWMGLSLAYIGMKI